MNLKAGFSTELGWCEITWKGRQICSLKIGRVTTRRASDSLPAWLKPMIRKIQRHVLGDIQNFSNCPLAFEVIPPFHRSVYRALCKVPAGKTVSYAELARRAGSPRAARAVGQAMAKNPFPILIPCHRVIAASGRIGNYSGGRGAPTKRRLLMIEGIHGLR